MHNHMENGIAKVQSLATTAETWNQSKSLANGIMAKIADAMEW